MAQVDFNERQLTLKLVYFGPPKSGKTTNLKSLHQRVDRGGRGRLMTLDTVDDRTLFFDLLPIFFRASGFSFRIKVYTVPGQPMHDATRRVVLNQADGVVFVADSDPAQADANRAAWIGLEGHLAALGLTAIPTVVQYNKRDLPSRIELDAADRFDQPDRPLLEAEAVNGTGVVSTFYTVALAVWTAIDDELGLAARFGIDREVFRTALASHVGDDGARSP